MTSFGFFHSTSSSLVNLLERTELFAVSQEIKDQLVEALADLVSLVAGVSTHFHQSIDALTEGSISINIYETFTGAIESFRERCAKISDSMWRHQLVNDNKDPQLGRKTSMMSPIVTVPNFPFTVSRRCQVYPLLVVPRGPSP